jgi:pimeloyl-ACP methyl ester carboxylesterase
VERALRLAELETLALPDGSRRFKHDPLHATIGPYGFEVATAARFWRAIRCPSLLVEGGESMGRHLPEEVTRRLSHFAHARQVTLPGAGHRMHWHQPEALSEMLIEFLLEPDADVFRAAEGGA